MARSSRTCPDVARPLLILEGELGGLPVHAQPLGLVARVVHGCATSRLSVALQGLYFAALTTIIACVDTTEGTLPRDLALMSLFHLSLPQGVTREDSNALFHAYAADGRDAMERGGQ